MSEPGRVLVVSHPAVLPVNQLTYQALAERGWSVHLVTPSAWKLDYAPGSGPAEFLPTLAGNGRAVRTLLQDRPQRHIYLTSMRRQLGRVRPDVVFCEQEPYSLAATQVGQAAHHAGVPFGVQMDENLDRRLPPPVRRLRSLVLARADFLAARSAAAAALAHRWGAAGEVAVVPHHMDSWDLPERPAHDVVTVGFAGRLVREKGIEVLVAALQRVTQPVDLLVVGDGPLAGWLRAQPLPAGSVEVVQGVAHRDMGGWYARMDMLVLPSLTTPTWSEQFGRVLVEALSCGTPVIGSDSGEIPWVIGQTQGGLVCREGDVEDLAHAVGRLAADSEERRRLAERGRRGAAALAGVEAVSDRLDGLLRRAVGRAAAARGRAAGQ